MTVFACFTYLLYYEVRGETRHRRRTEARSDTRHTPTHHQTPPEPSPKPLLTYALTPPAPRYPHSRHLPLLPPPLLPVELPTPLSPLSPLSRLNPLNLEVAYNHGREAEATRRLYGPTDPRPDVRRVYRIDAIEPTRTAFEPRSTRSYSARAGSPTIDGWARGSTTTTDG